MDDNIKLIFKNIEYSFGNIILWVEHQHKDFNRRFHEHFYYKEMSNIILKKKGFLNNTYIQFDYGEDYSLQNVKLFFDKKDEYILEKIIENINKYQCLDPRKKITHFTFDVAGTSYRQENIKKLAVKNEDYNLPNKELYSYLEKIYEYEFPVDNVEIIPEPENQYDKNALKVVANGIHIGYIKKDETKKVKKIIDSDNKKEIKIKIEGGKYKDVVIDDYTEKESIKKGETNSIFAKIKIKVYGEIKI